MIEPAGNPGRAGQRPGSVKVILRGSARSWAARLACLLIAGAVVGCTGPVPSRPAAVTGPDGVQRITAGWDTPPPSTPPADAGPTLTSGDEPHCAMPYVRGRRPAATVPPAPDTCSWGPDEGMASPGCPYAATFEAVDGSVVATGSGAIPPGTAAADGFGRWGGRGGGSMCFGAYADRTVLLTNGDEAVLVRPGDTPLRYVARTELTASDAIWGVLGSRVSRVSLTDPARGDRQVTVSSTVLGPGSTVFVAPVGTGPVTLTAFDPHGDVVAVATIS